MADNIMHAEQAEEAAQREAQRLAEEEELREHRRNLQFKVCGESWPGQAVGLEFVPDSFEALAAVNQNWIFLVERLQVDCVYII